MVKFPVTKIPQINFDDNNLPFTALLP